jgi:hypothetical protein
VLGAPQNEYRGGIQAEALLGGRKFSSRPAVGVVWNIENPSKVVKWMKITPCALMKVGQVAGRKDTEQDEHSCWQTGTDNSET